MYKVRFFQIVAVVASCLAASIASSQDAYPDRPVRIVVPYPPGGATDSAARVIARRPDAAAKLAPIGVIPMALTLKETADFLLDQGTKWAPVVKASGAQVD